MAHLASPSRGLCTRLFRSAALLPAAPRPSSMIMAPVAARLSGHRRASTHGSADGAESFHIGQFNGPVVERLW